MSIISEDDATKGFQWFCGCVILACLIVGAYCKSCNRDDNAKVIRVQEQQASITRTCLERGNRPREGWEAVTQASSSGASALTASDSSAQGSLHSTCPQSQRVPLSSIFVPFGW
jgi:hypothetical protein